MTNLTKAKLIRLSDRGNPEQEIPVQFNPASLRLALSNQVEGGAARGRQSRQFNGHSATDLTFDLHFDTADETPSSGIARSVREKTGQVEQFVLPVPAGAGSRRKLAPPRVRFSWGDLKIDGVISSLNIDFDLFAADGTPLRAKMSVSIKEQDPKYEIKQSEQAATAASSSSEQPVSTGPGHQAGGPDSPTNSTGVALAGESAADFAQRMGLDPAAWRGLAAGIEDPFSLPAGLAIDFDANLSASAGIGVSVGVSGGVSASLEAALGLEASAGVSLGVGGAFSAGTTAGFALSAAGGVEVAVERVAQARAQASVSASMDAFGVSAGAVASASTPDPRATSYGFGVPLRPRVSLGANARVSAMACRCEGACACRF